MFIVKSGTLKGQKQAKAWTYLLSKTAATSDVLPLTEQRLQEVKKHDVIDVGHRLKEIEEVGEGQLAAARTEKDLVEITEAQLEDKREDEDYVIIEGRMEDEDQHNASTWEGDDIKIYREVNRIQKMDAEANESFYKENKGRTTGGGVVSASKKKIQSD